MQIRSFLFSGLFVLGALSLAGCGDSGGGGEGLPDCPTDGTDLTYDNFGKDFFDNYCNSCHTEGSGIADAQDHPFTSLAEIKSHIDEIYEEAGSENTGMPPSGDMPSASERDQLTEWLSCGAN